MIPIIDDIFKSERTVESLFVYETIKKYYKSGNIVLDIGGIPTNQSVLSNFYQFLQQNRVDYRVNDFRACTYQGDFVTYNFKEQKFDIAIFLSSLEHFPQCTESDLMFRPDYDKIGYQKALSILNKGGYIVLTVPFGKHVWQKYHQNYDYEGILNLTQGSRIIEEYTYRLVNNQWVLSESNSMKDILYTDRAYGVGCFVMQKD
jgi:hypothetical protein